MRLPVSGSIILGDDWGGGEYTGREPPIGAEPPVGGPLPEGGAWPPVGQLLPPAVG